MKKFAIYSILGILLISLGVYSCCGGDGNNVDDTDSTKGTTIERVEDVEIARPTTLRFFIDASGSMRDYFGKEDIQNITDALSGANQAVENV